MKLNFSSNFKRLRLERQLTQEQIAEMLGVSDKSVSRWETEATYPDIELLPTIAKLFNTTVDELLGVDNKQNNERLQKLLEEFDKLGDDVPIEERLEFIRKIYRDYPSNITVLMAMINTLIAEPTPERVKELKMLTDDIHNHPTSTWIRNYAVRRLICVADEDDISELINKYTSNYDDMRELVLLKDRYSEFDSNNKNLEKYEAVRKELAYRDIPKAIKLLYPGIYPWPWPENDENTLPTRILLRFLNSLEGIDSEDPLPTDEFDIWTPERVNCGLSLSAMYAPTNPEKALELLERVVDVMERIAELPYGTKFVSKCPSFKNFTIELYMRNESGSWFKTVQNNCDLICIDRAVYGLTNEKGWEWFNPIRSNPRFKACAERVLKLSEKYQE